MRTHQVLLIAILALITGLESRAQPGTISVQDGSTLWIEGASTVNEWTCTADDLQGHAAVATDPIETQQVRARPPMARLAVATRSFECGRARMNRDFLDALQANQHPEITFELIEAVVLNEPADDGWVRLRVRGNLTIAGATRTVEADALGRQLAQGQFQLRGHKALTMTSFGIQPPVALLGLVKAKDEIEVHFDLRAGADDMASL